MKCAADLNALKYKLSLISLKIINKDKLVSFKNIETLKKSLKCYRLIIKRFHKSDKDKWSSLFSIGLDELDDHMEILMLATNSTLQSSNYNDCHNYLTASIQDTIDHMTIKF